MPAGAEFLQLFHGTVDEVQARRDNGAAIFDRATL